MHSEPATSHSPLATNADEVLVRVEGVSKKFCRSLKRSLWYGLCDIGAELNPFRTNELQAERGSELQVDGCKLEVPNLQQPTFNSGEAGPLQPATVNPQLSPPLRDGEFWAVNDVSFELRRGECLGLIGHNGAGKTTLLKMLNGLIKPDRGRIEMNGRVGALIALGAGFNPILTGRENIYINGSVLGLSKKEIDEKIDDIVNFAEIGEFIDMPVQNYSSGMSVRLGFSIASSLSPDVLILDEVLAVGDTAFRLKCYHRISAIRKNAAVIFVSHNMSQVARICDKGITLSHGTSYFYGGIEESIAAYNKLNQFNEDLGEKILAVHPPLQSFIVTAVQSFTKSGTPFRMNVQWKSDGELDNFLLRVVFISASSENVADSTFSSKAAGIRIRPGGGCWELETPILPLKNGRYSLSVTLVGPCGNVLGWSLRQVSFDIIGGSALAITNCHLPPGTWNGKSAGASDY